MQNHLYKIYVIVEKSKISELLIQYRSEDGKIMYDLSRVSPYSSIKEQNAFQEKIVKILFSDEYKDKIEFVYENDDKYFDIKEIEKYDILLKKKKKNSKRENIDGVLSLLVTVFNAPIHKLYLDILAIFWNVVALMSNKAVKNDSKKLKMKTLKFHTLKRQLYLFMLVWNLSSMTSNIYLNSSKIKESFRNNWSQLKIVTENMKIAFQREPDGVENPFKDMKYEAEENKVDVLLSAFSNNKFLSEDDKKIAMGLKKLLNDNPYINYQKLYDKYAEIAIIYTDLKPTKLAKDLTTILETEAEYRYDDNIIIDYFYDEESKKYHQDEIIHELIHTIGELHEYRVLNEGMTELLKIEYVKENLKIYKSYSKERLVTKILIELIGSDTVLKTFTTGDLTEMEEKLKAINSNPKTYQNLLDFLNMDFINYEDILKALFPYVSHKKNIDENAFLYLNDLARELDDVNYYNLEIDKIKNDTDSITEKQKVLIKKDYSHKHKNP